MSIQRSEESYLTFRTIQEFLEAQIFWTKEKQCGIRSWMSADTNNLNLNRPSASGHLIDATTADIDAERVDHLLIVKAFAEALGLVETVDRLVPSPMAVKPDVIVLGLVLDTLAGRSPPSISPIPPW